MSGSYRHRTTTRRAVIAGVAGMAALTRPLAARAALGTNWDEVIAGAKREGQLVLNYTPSAFMEGVLKVFQARHPYITPRLSMIPRSQFWPRVVTEQRNGFFAWDMDLGVPGGGNPAMAAVGALGDWRPVFAILPPSLMRDSDWIGGFAMWDRRADGAPGYYTFVTQLERRSAVAVNRKRLTRAQFSTIAQLTARQFAGKIIIQDFDRPSATEALGSLLAVKGDAFIARLLAKDHMFRVGARSLVTQWLVQGRYPIGIGYDPRDLAEFKAYGVGAEIEELTEIGASRIQAQGITLYHNAPHPNATAVFAAWFLSRDGQDVFTARASGVGTTRRRDVKIYNPSITPDPASLARYPRIFGLSADEAVRKEIAALVRKQAAG